MGGRAKGRVRGGVLRGVERLFTHEKIHRRDLAMGIMWSKEVHDGVRGGCRAAQSGVKSGVQSGR